MRLFKRAAPVAAPFLVQPTGEFDGNDGSWSTFSLGIGTPDQQTFRVLVSTLSSATWVPNVNGSCPSGKNVPDNCPSLRGVDNFNGGTSSGFNGMSSDSFHQVGIFQLSFSGELSMNQTFGKNSTYGRQSGIYATDDVKINSATNGSLTSTDSPIALINTLNFFVGEMGLSLNPIDPGQQSNIPSLLESLASSNSIPSRSWGYTAGAQYRDGGYLGNLVLGGYDQSRFTQNNITFSMPPSSDSGLLRVSVQSIQMASEDGSNYSFTSGSGQTADTFDAILDSTLPYLYLPESICDDMESRLGLRRTVDSEGNEIYLFDTSKTPKAAPQSIDIRVADTSSPSKSTTISIPFEGLNLTASWPLFTNGSRPYFPIRRAQQGSVNVLGRAFFQEAYVVADFERKHFQVARAAFPNPTPSPHIVPIYNSSFTPPKGSSSSGLSGGAIGGIVVGVIAGLVAVGALLYFVCWRRRKAKNKAAVDEAVAGAKAAQEEQERKTNPWRETFSTMSSTVLSEMEGGSGTHSGIQSGVQSPRPRPQRHMSELSSESEVAGRKTTNMASAIYELPDSEAWVWNQQRLQAMSPYSDTMPGQPSEESAGPSRQFTFDDPASPRPLNISSTPRSPESPEMTTLLPSPTSDENPPPPPPKDDK